MQTCSLVSHAILLFFIQLFARPSKKEQKRKVNIAAAKPVIELLLLLQRTVYLPLESPATAAVIQEALKNSLLLPLLYFPYMERLLPLMRMPLFTATRVLKTKLFRGFSSWTETRQAAAPRSFFHFPKELFFYIPSKMNFQWEILGISR